MPSYLVKPSYVFIYIRIRIKIFRKIVYNMNVTINPGKGKENTGPTVMRAKTRDISSMAVQRDTNSLKNLADLMKIRNEEARSRVNKIINLENKQTVTTVIPKNRRKISRNALKITPSPWRTKGRKFQLIKQNVRKGSLYSVEKVQMPHLRKALLIGINYVNVNGLTLNGCINDSKRLMKFLVSNGTFSSSDFTLMNDYEEGSKYPTKQNIINELNNIVNYCKSNPKSKISLFISYSGHGYNQRDYNGDEMDGIDEVLCPVDCVKIRIYR